MAAIIERWHLTVIGEDEANLPWCYSKSKFNLPLSSMEQRDPNGPSAEEEDSLECSRAYGVMAAGGENDKVVSNDSVGDKVPDQGKQIWCKEGNSVRGHGCEGGTEASSSSMSPSSAGTKKWAEKARECKREKVDRLRSFM